MIEIEAALSPSRKSLKLWLFRADESILCRKKEIKKEGRKIPMVANTPPVVPWIRYPANVALDNIGPGVICPTAMASINCWWLSQ